MELETEAVRLECLRIAADIRILSEQWTDQNMLISFAEALTQYVMGLDPEV